jgi:hypothetical protein
MNNVITIAKVKSTSWDLKGISGEKEYNDQVFRKENGWDIQSEEILARYLKEQHWMHADLVSLEEYQQVYDEIVAPAEAKREQDLLTQIEKQRDERIKYEQMSLEGAKRDIQRNPEYKPRISWAILQGCILCPLPAVNDAEFERTAKGELAAGPLGAAMIGVLGRLPSEEEEKWDRGQIIDFLAANLKGGRYQGGFRMPHASSGRGQHSTQYRWPEFTKKLYWGNYFQAPRAEIAAILYQRGF